MGAIEYLVEGIFVLNFFGLMCLIAILILMAYRMDRSGKNGKKD